MYEVRSVCCATISTRGHRWSDDYTSPLREYVRPASSLNDCARPGLALEIQAAPLTTCTILPLCEHGSEAPFPAPPLQTGMRLLRPCEPSVGHMVGAPAHAVAEDVGICCHLPTAIGLQSRHEKQFLDDTIYPVGAAGDGITERRRWGRGSSSRSCIGLTGPDRGRRRESAIMELPMLWY